MTTDKLSCDWSETTSAYAARALSAKDIVAAEDHIASCADCRRELESLHPLMRSFAFWPTDILRPPASLRERLAKRIAEETKKPAIMPWGQQWSEPEWDPVAPGIACKLLSSDTQRDRVSMLVRLDPGASYPAHTHAGVEELHLLDGELWIDERKLMPGDYNLGAPGTGDSRVYSETGCTCLLVTSPSDRLAE
jgi:hypothetical protein